MMRTLGALLAEQRSPLELLLFVAVAVVVFLVVSAALYAAIISLLTLRLPARVPLRRVLLPDRKRLMENLGDYLLAVFTSLLLTLTVMQKHELVEEISNYRFQEGDQAELARLFDLGLPEELGTELVDESVASVVEPILDAGRPERAGLMMKTLVVPRVRTGYAWMSPFLLAACMLLTAAYLAWLARRRFRVLRVDPDGEPEYGKTARGLFTLAVCVGLLLASRIPFAEGSEGLLAESALGAIAHQQAEERTGDAGAGTRIEQRVSEEIRRQDVYQSLLNCPDCEQPPPPVWTAIATGTDVGRTLEDRFAELEARWLAADGQRRQEIVELRAASTGMTQRLAGLESALREQEGRLAGIGRGLEDAQGCCTRLGERVDGLGANLTRTSDGLAELRRDHDRLAATFRGLREEVTSAIARAEQADEREHRELRRLIEQASREVTQAQRCCTELEGLRQRLDRLEERLKRLETPAAIGRLAQPAQEDRQ